LVRSYPETLDYLYSRLPVFQRIGGAAYKPGLDNILALCQGLGNPHMAFPTVHIGGTNGKGSSSHSLASILQEAGYKTGLYTSPHLKDFKERIRINGQTISETEVVQFVDAYQHLIENGDPSFFEVTVAMAMDHFKRHDVDIAVIEVGMGGRLDSTNIIHPLFSLITNIGWDHQKFLGDTLAKIAGEKAGIIKKNTPAIIGEWLMETLPVFMEKAAEMDAPLLLAQNEVEVESLGFMDGFRKVRLLDKSKNASFELNLSLLGEYQLQNLKGIWKAVELLINSGFPISNHALQEGLKKVTQNTGLLGRWQILLQNPLVICDTGHNEDGIRSTMQQLKAQSKQKTWIVWGMVSDKDHEKILKLLPSDAFLAITQPTIERAFSALELQSLATKLGFKSQTFASVPDALDYCLQWAQKEDLIFIGGSTFTVADIPDHFFSPGH
jgi:dihydrofolate synthase / folylpolyglutamate synthase